MRIKILVITGTRPEIIKLSPIIKNLSKDPDFSLILVHSGQHYDNNLFLEIFKDLDLPPPRINLKIGSGTHSYQIGNIMQEIEYLIKKYEPDYVMAQGDTNTVIAAALATNKVNKPFIHIEAGIRSFDKQMPEEINRIITGNCAKLNFAPTEKAGINLLFEGIPRDSIFIVGNTIVDAILSIRDVAEKKSNIFEKLGMDKDLPVVLITLHRPSNVDNKKNMESFVDFIISQKKFLFLFPIHPRTKKNLKKFELFDKFNNSTNILILEPLPYLSSIKIFSNSMCVITDSGGIQEEASILRIPCITLRNNTERPETLEYNSNILIGMDMDKLKGELEKIFSDPNYLKGNPGKNPFGNGKASIKIIEKIKKHYFQNKTENQNSKLWKKIPNKIFKTINFLEKPISVSNYEKKYNEKVIIIFNKEGIPEFPSDSKKIYNQLTLMVEK